jgi:hypothetical protein
MIEALAVGDKGVKLDVLVNDVAYTGSLKPKSITIVDGPDGGSVTVNKKGKLLYDPDPGFDGEDSFTYTVADKSGLTSNAATVLVQVNQPAMALALVDDLERTAPASEPADAATLMLEAAIA